MTRKELELIARQWIETKNLDYPDSAKAETVALCAEFSEYIFGACRKETEAWKSVAENAVSLSTPPIFISDKR